MKIGFFDSGIGGLTVLYEAINAHPQAHYIYFADTENVPYGTKSKKKIKKFVFSAVDFLLSKNIDLLVLACNTATSAVILELRKRHPNLPIIGMEPAIKPAAEITQTQGDRILVCATKLTLKEQKLNDLIHNLKAADRIDRLSLQKLVIFAETKKFKGKKLRRYLDKKFKNIDWQKYNSIVLGCTHFLYYKKEIARRIPEHIELLDGNEGTVKRMLELLPKVKPKNSFKLEYYQSKRSVDEKEIRAYFKLLKKHNQK